MQIRSPLTCLGGQLYGSGLEINVDGKYSTHQQHRHDDPDNAKRIGNGVSHAEKVARCRVEAWTALERSLCGCEARCICRRTSE